MAKSLIKLSVIVMLVFFSVQAKADSFFVASLPDMQYSNQNEDHIIPLVYIKNMEYYNHTVTAAYTAQITKQLSLEPEIIITEDENLADYYLQPKLLQSKIEPINGEDSRFSMSVSVELWAKGGVQVETERQNRYIVIKSTADVQEIAKKLLAKLLHDAVNNIILKIKNGQPELG